MLLSRQNLKGGRMLKGYPLEEENGVLGRKLGYCGRCNESILVRTTDAKEILAYFAVGEEEYQKLLKKLRPKIHWKERLIKWLGGYVSSAQLVDNY